MVRVYNPTMRDALKSVEFGEPPDGWLGDSLSQYLQAAHQNAYAAFTKDDSGYDSLREVTDVFFDAADLIVPGGREEGHVLSPTFFSKSFYSFLGAARFCLASQVPEAYVLMRASIEAAAYGYLIAVEPNLGTVWAQRGQSSEPTREEKNAITFGKGYKALKEVNEQLATSLKEFYELTIDFGAHPNRSSIMNHVETERTPDGAVLTHNIFSGIESLESASLDNSVSGLLVLSVFNLIFPERFSTENIPERLEDVNSKYNLCVQLK